MAQWVMALAIKPNDLNQIPGTHLKAKGENQLVKVAH